MLFKKAESTQAHVKAGVLGLAGSGKTFSTMQWVFGLKEMADSKAPICFFDTESGSDFFINACRAKGIELMQVKSRAFLDAVAAYDEALKLGADVIIFDSVTHIWRELCDTYAKRKNRDRLQFQDWQFLKGPDGWQRFTDKFLNAPIHTFICGRSGYEYEYQLDGDGKRELVKTGTKMRVEGEFGYEPSLLIEMEREKLSDAKHPTLKGWKHKMTILKDRTNTINGLTFEFTGDQVRKNPAAVFEAVRPHFDCLNLRGTQMGVDISRTSESLFESDGTPKAEWVRRRKQMLLEEIFGLLDSEWPGTTAEAKKKKMDVFVEIATVVGSKMPRSKTSFEALSLEQLENAHVGLVHVINRERKVEGGDNAPLLEMPDYSNRIGAQDDATPETQAEKSAA